MAKERKAAKRGRARSQDLNVTSMREGAWQA